MTPVVEKTMRIPEVIRQRFQNARRAEVRLEAAADAAGLVQRQRQWKEEDLHALMGLLQRDWSKGKVVRNRFGQGMVGQQVKWLVESIDNVGAWLAAVREAATAELDDGAAARLLQQYWDADLKNPYLFPTAVLAAMAPDRYVALARPVMKALHAFGLISNQKRTRDTRAYLEVCTVLRRVCASEAWPLCLADAALHVSPEPETAGTVLADGFQGYSEEAVEFLRSLPAHMQDPAWHQQNKERYERLLRDTTMALVNEIGARYIAPLDAEVAEPNRPTSILKKNDFGGDSYYSHYWFAFFDPAAARKTESVQLFAIYYGAEDYFRYGVGVGHYGRAYHDNLVKALRSSPAEAAGCFERLPDGFVVRLEYKDEKEVVRRPDELAGALREAKLDDFLGDEPHLRSIDVQRRVDSLDVLIERGRSLVDDFGSAFVAVWPLFEAARTGTFTAKDEPQGEGVLSPEPVDEDAPDSIADLSSETSVSETLLEEIEEALLAKGQAILLGPPGTSKTYVAEQFARYFVGLQPGVRPQGAHRTIYMHASWAYDDFFEGIRPKVDGTGLQFASHKGAFLSWIEDTVRKGPHGARYVLVLDEINRCDTAAVLGELLQLMEYRGQPVQLLSGRTFTLPRRLYILGTMNSADRSIGRLDLALRRRFLFIDLLPDCDVLETWLGARDGRNPCDFSADALSQCNDWLEQEHGIPRDQQVGHALFMPSAAHGDGAEDDGALTGEMVRRIVRYSVFPYVRELLAERGRDIGAARERLESFFSPYWSAADEDE